MSIPAILKFSRADATKKRAIPLPLACHALISTAREDCVERCSYAQKDAHWWNDLSTLPGRERTSCVRRKETTNTQAALTVA